MSPIFRLRPLSTLADHHRLDRVLLPDVDSRTGKQRCGFETEEDALKEDGKRVRLLMQTPTRSWEPGDSIWLRFTNWGDLNPQAIGDLADRLKKSCETGVHCKSLASSFTM